MKLGLIQLLVEGTEPERNFERAIKLIAQAAESGCDMVLLPETIDFAWTHPAGLNEAKPIPGTYSDLFCSIAREKNIWICVGLTEYSVEGNYNSSILINRQGNITAKHRKINLLNVEFPYYEIGQTLNVVNTEFGKIGLNICADNYLDSLHIGHALARMGAQLILAPSSWTVDHNITEADDPYHKKWIKPLSTLAELYGLVIASATSVGYIVGGPYMGKKMVGCSLCVGRDGIIAKGIFNEFAGELVIAEFELPVRKEKGTEIGEMLQKKGHFFDK
jgi:predicted amidohydrolase